MDKMFINDICILNIDFNSQELQSFPLLFSDKTNNDNNIYNFNHCVCFYITANQIFVN